MSAFGITALVLAALWLAAASLAILVLIRQVALLTLRLDRIEEGPALDGISVGSLVPETVMAALTASNAEQLHVLVLSATCGPCRELADELAKDPPTQSVIALIGGEREPAAAIGERLPGQVRVVLDPEASQVIDSLDLKTSPFLFTFEGGKVTDKASVRNGAHLLALLDRPTVGERQRQPSLEVTHAG